MLDIDDYITRDREEEKPVGYCGCCGDWLFHIDTILVHNDSYYCDYECLSMELELTDTELETSETCSFCGNSLEAGESVIKADDGAVFCDKACTIEGFAVWECRGYDL